jgi:hypothetical protein
MATLMALGFDDTIPIPTLSAFGGTAGLTGANGLGLWARQSGTNATTVAIFTNLSTMAAAPLSTFVIGFRMRASNASSAVRWGTFVSTDGTTVHFGIGFDATSHVVIYGPANTVVATSAATFLDDTAYYTEVKATIHDTTGSVEVRMAESVVVSYSGDTRNGATTQVGSFAVRNTGSGSTLDIDDLYLDDTAYKGDMAVVTLKPNGNGDSSQFNANSDGNSTDNYALVNESPTPSMTTYVGDATSGHIDLYTMDDLPAGYVVDSMYETALIQKSDAGTPPTLLPVAKGQSGTVRTDTAFPALSTTAVFTPAQLRTTDPDGNALTVARINAMQVGVKIS